MPADRLRWDDFILALHEGLDGIDYKTAKRVHRALYPEARVTQASGRVLVTWPEEESMKKASEEGNT